MSSMSSDRVEAVLDQLRANDERITAPRRAVVTALAQSAGHLSAADIGAAVQAVHPDVNTSTVYRTLDLFVDLGIVVHLHLAHGPAVYHLADDRHLHVACTGCGRVFDAPADLLRSAARRLDEQLGFTLDSGHVALTGQCRECRTRAEHDTTRPHHGPHR